LGGSADNNCSSGFVAVIAQAKQHIPLAISALILAKAPFAGFKKNPDIGVGYSSIPLAARQAHYLNVAKQSHKLLPPMVANQSWLASSNCSPQ